MKIFENDDFFDMVDKRGEAYNYKWFDGYDKMTGGIHPGDSLMLFSDKGSGKTMLALSAVHALAKQGKTVTYITLDEMPMSILKRIAGREREEIRDYDLNVIDPCYRLGEFNKRQRKFDVEKNIRTEEQKKYGEFSPEYYSDKELENDVIVIDGVYLGAKELSPLKCIYDWNVWAQQNEKIVIITILTEGELTPIENEYITTGEFEKKLNCSANLGTFVAYLRELGKENSKEGIACSVVRNKNDWRGRECGGQSKGTNEALILVVNIKRCEVLNSHYENIDTYISN